MTGISRYELRQEIKKLNRLDPKLASYSAIVSTYRKITDGLTIIAGIARDGELYYRVRKQSGDMLGLISDLQAPPPSKVLGYQRCNPPGIPMFYAASRPIGALIECRVEAGDIVYLSQWIGKERLAINKIFDREDQQIIGGIDTTTVFGPNNDVLLTYLDSLYTKRIHSIFADDYKFTAALAQQLTTGHKPNAPRNIGNDGLIALRYPSVLDLENSYNTVMHATFAAERLDILQVIALRIQSANGTYIAVEVLDTATSFSDGKIEWTGNRGAGDLLDREELSHFGLVKLART